MNSIHLLFNFVLIIAIMLFAGDLVTRSTPAINRQYRRILRGTWNFMRRQTGRLVRWAWRNYRQFIIGVGVGVIATLYFTGHFG